MRITDRAMKFGFNIKGQEAKQLSDKLKDELSRHHVFIFDDALSLVEDSTASPEQFSGIFPPYDKFVIETIVNYDGHSIDLAIACSVLTERELPDHLRHDLASCKWMFCATELVWVKSNNPSVNIGASLFFGIHKDGVPHKTMAANVNADNDVKCLAATFRIIFTAISFLNCKNVIPREASDEEVGRKVSRRGLEPKIRYHILDVHQVLIPGISGEPSPKVDVMPLHLCRGHVRVYRDGGPGMFGRGIYGRFFIRSHARGSAKNGIVDKDYRI